MKSRKEIFKLLDKEREYQDNTYGDEFDKLNSIGHWIIYLEEYLEQAKKKFFGSRIPGGAYLNVYMVGQTPDKETAIKMHRIHKEETLKKVVKIGALVVACLEHMSEEENVS